MDRFLSVWVELVRELVFCLCLLFVSSKWIVWLGWNGWLLVIIRFKLLFGLKMIWILFGGFINWFNLLFCELILLWILLLFKLSIVNLDLERLIIVVLGRLMYEVFECFGRCKILNWMFSGGFIGFINGIVFIELKMWMGFVNCLVLG